MAGNAAGVLFSLGVIGVGFLAVPVMTGGAAYDLCQAIGWKYGLNKRPAQAKRFYIVIAVFTVLGAGMNFLGFNPMKALVVTGRTGILHPASPAAGNVHDEQPCHNGAARNGRAINILGWITTPAIFAASVGLVATLAHLEGPGAPVFITGDTVTEERNLPFRASLNVTTLACKRQTGGWIAE